MAQALKQSLRNFVLALREAAEGGAMFIAYTAWILWIFGSIANGLVGFLLVVFGPAVWPSGDASGFVALIVLAVLISIGGCLYAFSRGKFLIGVALNWGTLPAMLWLMWPKAMGCVLWNVTCN